MGGPHEFLRRGLKVRRKGSVDRLEQNLRQQYDRLKLLANNSRFLILPGCYAPNLGSRVLSLCQKRLSRDWQNTFGHPVLLLETFVDPQRFRGTVYRAANWLHVGDTKGFRRTSKGYSAKTHPPKMVFMKPLQPKARELLSRPLPTVDNCANNHTIGKMWNGHSP